MCFSATASFTASAALGAGGLIILHKVKRQEERPLAAIPLIFAAHQAIEGLIWTHLGDPVINHYLAMAYVAIAGGLWPILLPAALSFIEPSFMRRTFLRLLGVLGLGLGAWTMGQSFLIHVTAQVWQSCLVYQPLVPGEIYYGVYVLIVCGSCIASSHQLMRLFGVGLVFSFLAAYTMNFYAGASVWCFFAAILSGIIYLQVSHAPVKELRKALNAPLAGL